jgi:hypothetical protein
MRLYHISKNPNLSVMIPRVPENSFTQTGLEDGKTKRICFAQTIDACIAAIGSARFGDIYFVYSPVSVDPKAVYKPKPSEVPDAKYTHEVWYLKPVAVKKVKTIVVGSPYLYQLIMSARGDVALLHSSHKAFKKDPSRQQVSEFLKTQPDYQKFMMMRRKDSISDKIKSFLEIIKKALRLSSGSDVYMLAGRELKPIKK